MAVTVNADKSMSFNGVRKFPAGMYNIGSYFMDTVEGIDVSISKLRNFTMGIPGIDNTAMRSYAVPIYNDNQMYYGSYITDGADTSQPYFMGWINKGGGTDEIITAAQFSDAYNNYQAKKSSGTVYVATWLGKPSGSTYGCKDVADVVMPDLFMHAIKRDPITGAQIYPVEDFLFAHEKQFKLNFLNTEGYDSIDAYPKPMHFVLDGVSTTYENIIPMTKQELRGQAYWAITTGVMGIHYWVYKAYPVAGEPNEGLINSPTLTAMYNSFAGELTSPEIQNILLLPTTAYSWDSEKSWNNTVTFSNNPTKVLVASDGTMYYGSAGIKSLSYRYKIDPSDGSRYLIAANKNINPVTTNIVISGLSGSMTAVTLGTETTGSSRAGRSIPVSNGAFSDTFDGYAGHVYKISAGGSSASISTNKSSYNASESVTVNWSGSADRWDWIGLYLSSDQVNAIESFYLNGTGTPPAAAIPSGSLVRTAPAAQGSYVYKLIDGATLAPRATSPTFTVGSCPETQISFSISP